MAIHDIPWDVTNFDAKPVKSTLLGQIDAEVRNTRQASRQRFKPEHNFDMANDDMQGIHKTGSARVFIGDADAPGYPASPQPDYSAEETEASGGRTFVNLDTGEVSVHGTATIGTNTWIKVASVTKAANTGVVRDNDGFSYSQEPIYDPGDPSDSPNDTVSTKGYVETRIANGAPEAALPIGFIYVQFPGQTAPATLWPSMTWTNVSDLYAAAFFRAEGTADSNHIASAFGSGAQIDLVKDHRHTADHNEVGVGTTRDRLMEGAGSALGGYVADGLGGSETRPMNYTIRIWKRTA